MFNYREIVPNNNNKQKIKDIDVNSLVHMNHQLENKMTLLYQMLGGNSNSLVEREEICEEKYNKALNYIAKLKRGKQDLLKISRDLYERLDEAEEEREKLISHIQNLELQMRNLEYENMKLRRELSEAKKFINQMLSPAPENAIQEPMNYEGSLSKNVNNLDMSLNMPNMKKEDVSTEGIKKSIEQLTLQVENIQVFLKRLTDPITSPSIPNVNNNPYGEIENFVD